MTNDERKFELKKRRRLASYPRRAKAQFTAANDHNPLVLQNCCSCHGTGNRDRHYDDAEGHHVCVRETCSGCGGTGITGEVEHYFIADQPKAAATTDAAGWLRCPGCGIAFTTRDPDRWTGYRHLNCGQRIQTSPNVA